MNEQLQKDLGEMDSLLRKVTERGLEFVNNISDRPTSHKSPQQSESKELVNIGLGGMATLDLFRDKFEKIMVASTGPRYWGFVTGGATPASIAGDWLAAVYDQNTQSVKGQGDISALIEKEAIAWVLDLFNLPKEFLGGFVTGATMSNFTCLAVARQWVGKKNGRDVAREGMKGDIPVLSATPHSSALKSLSMLGIGSSQNQQLKTNAGNRESIDLTDLEQKINALNGKPFILISSAGTVNTADFDDFEAIARLHAQHTFWWHIDGAFGAFAACSSQYKQLLNGWDKADSITVDCHKWMNVPYENALFLIKEKHSQLQMETFQNSNAPYLGNPMENFSYLNFLPENSRRLRALPVWFTLAAYGKNGYQDIVDNSIEMAQLFGKFIEQSTAFSLLAPVRLNNVCFTLTTGESGVSDFLSRLNETGKVFMTPTFYNGQKGIRASFVNWRTNETDVYLVIAEMEKLV